LTTDPIVCDPCPTAGELVRTPNALPGERPRPVLREVYYVAISRRSLAEIVPIAFSSLQAANRFAKAARTDPDIAIVEVTQLVRRRAGD
jgi:hypothetical protein